MRIFFFFIYIAVHHRVDVRFQEKGEVIEGVENSTEFLSIIKKTGRYNLTIASRGFTNSYATNIFESAKLVTIILH